MVRKAESNTFEKRLKSMLRVDFRRMYSTSLFYMMVGIAFVIPVLILVMTTMMDGSVSVNPQTGEETVLEGFKNVWQIFGSTSAESSAMDMSLTGMCNINMLFFLVAVIVCIFVSNDFRSGYAKNLFTVRAKKSDYVISKLSVSFIAGASMLIAFFVGAMIGGAVAGVSFELGTVTIGEVVMCMLSKIFLVMIFNSIYLMSSVFAKQKLWLSILLSFGIGMLFFTMIPMITPLDSSLLNVVLCLAGGVAFSVLFGYVSVLILNKRDIL